MRRRRTRKAPEGVGPHHICTVCDAVIPSEKCPAQDHWLELRLGGRKHKVVRCGGDCLGCRIGTERARNVTMRFSLGLWTDEDLIARLEELRVQIEEKSR